MRPAAPPPSAAGGIRARRRRSRPASHRCPPSAAAAAPGARPSTQELRQLRTLVASDFVQIEELADLRERQAEALAAQDQLDAHPLALAVDARAARPLRRQQAAILVEADRARGQRELLRELGDRVSRRAAERVAERLRMSASIAHRDGTVRAARTYMPGRRCRSTHDTIPVLPRTAPPCPRRIPPSSTIRSPRRRRRATTLDVAPGIKWLRMPLPFALDHINLWLRATKRDGCDARRHAATATPPTRALWDAHFATTLRRRAARRASSPRTTIPTISATRRGSRSASA